MSEQDDIDAIAGEYVLGTLTESERADVDRRRADEPALDEAIAFWERLLSSLDEMTPEVRASEATWLRIAARTIRAETTMSDAAVVDLSRRVKLWRAATLVSAIVAIGFGIGFLHQVELRHSEQTFVAVLQQDAASPAFIVEVNVQSRSMSVRPVAAKPQTGKSYELWLIHDSLGAPKSLGVIADEGFTVRPDLVNYDVGTIESALFAVTLEPQGGSPNGKPSAAPLWSGKLFQATP